MEARTLTQRRRAATEMDIALATAQLFSERGTSEVTVEEIAALAGVSVRTFYRYFPTKEDAIGPLLAVGASDWQDAIADADEPDVIDAIRSAIAQVLAVDAESSAQRELLGWTRDLIRRTAEDASLRGVWSRANADSEIRLAAIIAGRLGDDADPLTIRLLAAAGTDAIRVSLEHWAIDDGAAFTASAALAQSSFDRLSAGLRSE